MYYAALRPAEAVNLRKADCGLPETGWGWLHLARTTTKVGKRYTDSGQLHDDKGPANIPQPAADGRTWRLTTAYDRPNQVHIRETFALVRHGFMWSAEGEGFEPSRTVTSPSGFQDRRHRPLGEPSLVPPAWLGGGRVLPSHTTPQPTAGESFPANHSSRTTESPPHSSGATSRSVCENVH